MEIPIGSLAKNRLAMQPCKSMRAALTIRRAILAPDEARSDAVVAWLKSPSDLTPAINALPNLHRQRGQMRPSGSAPHRRIRQLGGAMRGFHELRRDCRGLR